MPLDKEQYTSTNPTSFPSISVDNGLLVGDTLSTQNITGKILYSGTGTTYIPVGISTVVANSVAYQATAPSNPSVGQIWVDSSSNNTNYDPNLIRRKTIVATGGQTAFTADLAFTDGYEQVFLNGLLLTRNTDYTTVNSIQVNLVVAAVVNDVIDILSITNLNSVGAAGALTTSNTFTGAQTFTPSSAAITPITINEAFNQTGDILNINNYSGTNLLKIDKSGNILTSGYALIGKTSNAYATLDVNGSFHTSSNFNGGTSGYGDGLIIGQNSINGAAEIAYFHGNPAFASNGGHRFLQKTGTSTARSLMYMRGDGNVGIGTDSPGYTLDVRGTVYSTALDGSISGMSVATANQVFQANTDTKIANLYPLGNGTAIINVSWGAADNNAGSQLWWATQFSAVIGLASNTISGYYNGSPANTITFNGSQHHRNSGTLPVFTVKSDSNTASYGNLSLYIRFAEITRPDQINVVGKKIFS